MFKYSITISGNTLAELYASAAEIAARDPAPFETSNGYVITPATRPAASETAPAASTDDEGQADPNAPEYDIAGTPWDKRIHASTKTRNEDGTWRRRRNLSDVAYNSVMAELSQRGGPGTQPAAPPVAAAPAVPASPAAPVGIVDDGPVTIPPAPAVPAPVMAAPAATAPAVPPAPAIPAPPVPEAPAAPVAAAPVTETPAPPVAGGMPFNVLMPKLSDAMKAGKFTDDALKGWLAQWELTSIMQLQSDPIKAQQFYNWLKQSNLVD